jgi:hypothetical protein
MWMWNYLSCILIYIPLDIWPALAWGVVILGSLWHHVAAEAHCPLSHTVSSSEQPVWSRISKWSWCAPLWATEFSAHCELSQEAETPPVLTTWDSHGQPHRLQNDSVCGTWVTEGPGGSVVLEATYSGCYVTQWDFRYVMLLEVATKQRLLRCPVELPAKRKKNRYLTKNGTAGSYGSSLFSFLESLYTDFHSGWTSLHSHKQCMRIPFPLPHILASFTDACFLYDRHLDSGEMESQRCFNLHFL